MGTVAAMRAPPQDNRYWAEVDASTENDAHAFALDLIGYSKRVLELGPAAGHVTRALVRRGCEVTGIEIDAEAAAGLDGIAECIVADLSDPSVVRKAGEERGFDVVLAGDVLEHLPDPLPTLRACRDILVPGGYIVVSLPNIAHADVALSLVSGRFAYQEYGLLDRTHLRFFTHDSVTELLEQAGFVAIDVRRVIRPVFGAELGLDPSSYAPELVEAVLAHPEAETYQFVVRAVPHDGSYEVSRLAARTLEACEEARRERTRRIAAEGELAVLRTPAKETAADAKRARRKAKARSRKREAEMASRSMRYTAPMRAALRMLRPARR